MSNLAVDINLFDSGEGQLKGFGPLGEAADAPSLFNKFINGVVGLMTVVAFIWFIILLITGAIGIMTAGGDKNALQTNVKKITNGLIGIIVIIGAILLIKLISTLLGLDTSKLYFLNPGQFIIDFKLI